MSRGLAIAWIITALSLLVNVICVNINLSVQKHKYEVVCGNLNDCCRTMIDAYDLPDSIYNHYLDVIEEEGFNKQEIEHLYFSY